MILLSVIMILETIISNELTINKIDNEVIFSMIQSCLLAFPDPGQTNQREACLLHIEDYFQTITRFNDFYQKNSLGVYNFQYASPSRTLELEQLQDFNGGIVSIKTTLNISNIGQKWIFIKEGIFYKIKNALFGKCITLPQLATEGAAPFVQDCVANNLEQLFVTNDYKSKVKIQHYYGLCLNVNTTTNTFLTINCVTLTTRNFQFKNNLMIVNPFSGKCLKLSFAGAQIENCNRNSYQRLDVFLINPSQDLYSFKNNIDGTFMANVLNSSTITGSSFSETDPGIIFKLEFLKTNLFKIKSYDNSKCIAIDNIEDKETALLIVQDCSQIHSKNVWKFISF
jgi:hypothetical protein